MKLTDREKILAARALERIRIENDPRLSREDRELMKKYPRHTLAAAKYIDSCDCGESSVGKGCEDAFWKIRMQETHNPRCS